ncbi:MAG: glycosyltransferase family 87 protein, partial [Chloroflexota bacterium]
RGAIALLLGTLLAQVIVTVIQVAERADPGDFGAFVAAGQLATRGLNPYSSAHPLVYKGAFVNLNPPLSLLACQVIAWVDPMRGYYALIVGSVALHVLTVAFLAWRYRGWDPAFLIWGLANAGIWEGLPVGNIWAVMPPLVALGWYAQTKGAAFWGGAPLGLLIALKPNFALLPVVLFLAGHRAAALWSVGWAALLYAVPALYYGPQVYLQWWQATVGSVRWQHSVGNYSFVGEATRWGVPALGTAASLVVVVAVAYYAWRRRPGYARAAYAGLLLSLLASPLAWASYLAVLLVPFAALKWTRPMRVVAVLFAVPWLLMTTLLHAAGLDWVAVGTPLLVALCLLLYDAVKGMAGGQAERLLPPMVKPPVVIAPLVSSPPRIEA